MMQACGRSGLPLGHQGRGPRQQDLALRLGDLRPGLRRLLEELGELLKLVAILQAIEQRDDLWGNFGQLNTTAAIHRG